MRTGRAARRSFAERRAQRAEVDDPAIVLDAALRFLEARPRSVHEVRRRLVGGGYRTDLVDGAVDRLLELGMLDDESFARSWVESRDRARPRGERALRQELRLKGIDPTVVDAVLADRRWPSQGASGVETGGGDVAAAERLIESHARTLARIADPRVRRQRAYGLLARNGFDVDVCREAAARVVASAGRDEADIALDAEEDHPA